MNSRRTRIRRRGTPARWLASAGVLGLAACGFSGPPGDPGPLADVDITECKPVDDITPVDLGIAKTGDEHALIVAGQSEAVTTWSTEGNEAVVLDVLGGDDRLIGHLVLHQGNAAFDYSMHLGALTAGEPIRARVSALTAPNAARRACVAGRVVPASGLAPATDVAEGLPHAPIFRWPVQKRFDDIPLVVGWSRTKKTFETVFSHEDGGTVALCGGGAAGVLGELSRWGRAADIETTYRYDPAPQWLRCTGDQATPLRTEASHPILYYGDGNNRLFESRDGYGRVCGVGPDRKASGDLDGWNVNNPSNTLDDDADRVIILRPLPFDLDGLGYAAFAGRREALIDAHAPWLYRLNAHELTRERMVDNRQVLAMERYLYVDIQVADVDGTAEEACGPRRPENGGFRLRAVTPQGPPLNGWLVTGPYVTAPHDWKRVAIPLPQAARTADVTGFVLDAVDSDGIYVTAIGDAFIVQPSGANGATLEYVRRGERAVMAYVDDNNSDCSGAGAGVNTRGPGGVPYTCSGSLLEIAK